MPHDPRAQRNGNHRREPTREQQLLYLALRRVFWLAHGREPGENEFVEWLDRQDWVDKFRYDDVLTPEEITAFDSQNR